MRKTDESDAIYKVKHRNDNPVANLEYAIINKSTICCKA